MFITFLDFLDNLNNKKRNEIRSQNINLEEYIKKVSQQNKKSRSPRSRSPPTPRRNLNRAFSLVANKSSSTRRDGKKKKSRKYGKIKKSKRKYN